MRSIFLNSVLQIWNSTTQKERQMVIDEVAEKHGSGYTLEQFLSHLEQQYRSRFSSYVLPPIPERKALSYSARLAIGFANG